MKNYLCLLLLLLFNLTASAQSGTAAAFNQKEGEILKIGMVVLGGWALLNIIFGSFRLMKASRSKKFLHQMNIYFNIVNICIAGFALYFILTENAARTLAETVRMHYWYIKILYLSIGLDVSYMLLGAYLQEKSRNSPKTEQYLGWGQSLVLQGLFLFLLDLALTILLEKHTSDLMRLL
ncbi:DUF6992 family protein [Pontibacter vulgaris]|uniref:DUF6992 family protein n=1 Tax=Pontibacter vulgaris TaxID=2905679 RepID=UPI001FA6F35B|nr:hypothetical protein [Pontibacter vulgaris]